MLSTPAAADRASGTGFVTPVESVANLISSHCALGDSFGLYCDAALQHLNNVLRLSLAAVTAVLVRKKAHFAPRVLTGAPLPAPTTRTTTTLTASY